LSSWTNIASYTELCCMELVSWQHYVINFRTVVGMLKLLQERCACFHFYFSFLFIYLFFPIILCWCLLQVWSPLGELYQVGDRGQKTAECDKPLWSTAGHTNTRIYKPLWQVRFLLKYNCCQIIAKSCFVRAVDVGLNIFTFAWSRCWKWCCSCIITQAEGYVYMGNIVALHFYVISVI